MLGAIDDVVVMVLAIDLFLEGVPEGLVAEKLVALGIPPSELESDLARVRRVVPRPLLTLVGRVPGLLDRLAERIAAAALTRDCARRSRRARRVVEGNAA